METLESNSTILNKRPRSHLSSPKEINKVAVNVKPFGVPLLSATTGCPCDSISFRSDRPCIIGRKPLLCDYVFKDRRVSKRHFQLFFDNVRHKIFISDGCWGSNSTISACSGLGNEESRTALAQFHSNKDIVQEVEQGNNIWKLGDSSFTFRESINGVFLNRNRIRIGTVAELSTGDEILLVCSRNECHCSLGIRIGFIIESIDVLTEEIFEANDDICLSERTLLIEETPFTERHSKRKSSYYDECISRGNFLLGQCRQILHSNEPIPYLKQFVSVSFLAERHVDSSPSREIQLSSVKPKDIVSLSVVNDVEINNRSPVLLPYKLDLSSMVQDKERVDASVVNQALSHASIDDLCEREKTGVQFEMSLPSDGSKSQENSHLTDNVAKITSGCTSISPPGKNFYLNSLTSVEHDSFAQHPVISLHELVYPVESLVGIFIATFTSNILWFISHCKIPSHLPVTIACHNTERCWNSSLDKRSSVPYSDFPNLVVVNPLFPETIAFGNDRTKQGIACHHPKLLVLVREEHLRVVITSANLVEKQWNSITNTIWWQDFPRASSPDYLSLFAFLSREQIHPESGSDFAAQLAGFMATLLIDVPTQAHWILELAKYNFKGAVGHLVASIPGFHVYRTPRVAEYMQFIHEKMCDLSSHVVNFLGSVEASVVGSNHLFHSSADSSGGRLRKLAMFLGTCCRNAFGMSEVVLRRNTQITVDVNAVSVFVPNPDEIFEGDCIQLGFLPRNIAKWVSPLWDNGFFRFSGHICPKNALSAILGGDYKKIQLTLFVSQGPRFSEMSNMMGSEYVSSLCSLLASNQRCTGLWRLEEVLGRYSWPESLETDFFYGASSIGTAVNAQFMASFSAAVGKRSFQNSDSQESDPEWGCWNTSQESRSPSIKILFPTISRVQNASCGILPSKRILCFAERTWQKLRPINILHDAIPHPNNRIGHPMHVKVAQRRFQSKKDATSFGWVYSGSHNFSAAAWGRPMLMSTSSKHNEKTQRNDSKVLKLHVCNYELGIIFVFPPPNSNIRPNHESTTMDDIVLPLVVPAPKYGPRDKPATKLAMREVFSKLNEEEMVNVFDEAANEEEMMEEAVTNEEEEEEVVDATDCVSQEEKDYAETLWNQVVP